MEIKFYLSNRKGSKYFPDNVMFDLAEQMLGSPIRVSPNGKIYGYVKSANYDFRTERIEATADIEDTSPLTKEMLSNLFFSTEFLKE